VTAARQAIVTTTSLTVGIPLACLWAFNAAGVHVPGQGAFRLALLIVASIGFLVWRTVTAQSHPPRADKCGVTVGLACWFVAATTSLILNWKTDEVILTYVSVFLSGGAIYFALSGVRLAARDLDMAIVGLAIGALFPLMSGLLAFGSEWGNPDVTTTISAWQNVARMRSYGDATFGNRGNTAGFLLIVTPMLLAILFDKRKRLDLRAFCAVTLIPVALNLVILQVRAAYLTLLAALVVVWAFKLGTRRLPLLAVGLVLSWVILFKFQPEVGLTMTERLLPAITVDTAGDESVQGRADAINEGWRIAQRNWLLGIGPGAALTVHSYDSAHQFQVQQAMETGILGFAGALLFTIGVFVALFRTMVRGRRDEVNDTRFMLLIGPASFVTYATIANAALNNSSVNTWTVLVGSMLALMPPFAARARRVRAETANAARSVRPQLAPVAGAGIGSSQW
jgi:hypothetical protein